MNNVSNSAPGAPGDASLWSRSAKDAIGTAYHTSCRLWFTCSQGIISEVYCPTVDQPNTRDLQLLITDGESFCHEEKVDLHHQTEIEDCTALLYRMTNTDRNGRYRIIKYILADPHAPVLLIHTRLEIMDAALRGKLRLYALLTPHIGSHGGENNADWLDVGERTLLHAERNNFHLVLGCDKGFSKRSVGYVGASDGWQDLHQGKFEMDWQYRHAGPGNVALIGEIALNAADSQDGGGDVSEFVLGVSFGDSASAAAAGLLQAFATPFEKHREVYINQWQRAAVSPDAVRGIAENTGDGGKLFSLSHRVLLAHEDKEFKGAIVASLSTPWGESKTDDDDGGYHLVWTRDLVQSATALLATGEIATPMRALIWLMCIQKPDGSFPQNSWIDGEPHWQGIQLDEMASPLLLAWHLWNTARDQYEQAMFRPVLQRAVGYLFLAGPASAQDRWEENAGYSASTLATMIAAFCIGSELSGAHGHSNISSFAIEYADWLNSHVEDWCVTGKGEVLKDKPRHYIRMTPADALTPDPHPDVDSLEIALGNGGGTHPARSIVSADFLHLVRLGIRPHDDPIVLDSIAVNDAACKRDLPGGPCWRRYPHDGYGQKPDGSPYDGTGEGRCWPILTGERGHYELAAGRDPMPYIRAMEQFANTTGLMPEQVWDSDDIPQQHQLRGRPSGSATPLCWSHAEYINLVRSRRDGKVFDRVEPAYQRYVVGGKRDASHEIWTFRHRTRRLPAGRTLRLIIQAPAIVHWTNDGWKKSTDTRTASAIFGNIFFVDLPTSTLLAKSVVEWTFFWPEADRWEGGDNFRVEVV